MSQHWWRSRWSSPPAAMTTTTAEGTTPRAAAATTAAPRRRPHAGDDDRHRAPPHRGTEATGAGDHRGRRRVAPGDIATDIGVDDTTITVGMLADLSGAFAPLVTEIVEAQQVYWDDVNAQRRHRRASGRAGRRGQRLRRRRRTSEQEKYAGIRDKVAIFSQSTGSPHTAAIAPNLVEDDLIAIPLSWYSGWAFGELGAERVRVVHELLHRVDERHRVASQEPGRADGRDSSRSRASTAATARRAPRRQRGARAGGRVRRHRPGDAAVGRQPEPGPDGDHLADRRQWRRPRVGLDQPDDAGGHHGRRRRRRASRALWSGNSPTYSFKLLGTDARTAARPVLHRLDLHRHVGLRRARHGRRSSRR